MATVILRGIPRLTLHLSEMIEDIPNTGIMVARRHGPEVVLTEGKNDISDEFWRAWAEQNKQSGFRQYIIEDNAN